MRRMAGFAAVIVCLSLLLAACGAKDAASIVKDLDKVVTNMESYQGKGTMILHTGQQPLEYKVEVWYQQPQYYRIALTNAKKDITQIVLRNDDGVFVLTPKLNKSFRFQSDWPNNQGQVYLYQTLIQSILVDNSRQFVEDKESNAYIFDVMANYQNGSLSRQRIWLNKDNYAPLHVQVSDANATVMVEVKFDDFKFGAQFEKSAFDMQANMEVEQKSENTGAEGEPAENTAQPDAVIDEGNGIEDGEDTEDGVHAEHGGPGEQGDHGEDLEETAATPGSAPHEFVIMEPGYLPEGVALKDMEDIAYGESTGVMQRYSGTYDFTLIQSMPRDQATALMPGDIIDLGHTYALLSGEEQRTMTWTYDGYEYRLASGTLPEAEMFKVAQSVMEEMGK